MVLFPCYHLGQFFKERLSHTNLKHDLKQTAWNESVCCIVTEADPRQGLPCCGGPLFWQEAGGSPRGVLQQPAGVLRCWLCAHFRSDCLPSPPMLFPRVALSTNNICLTLSPVCVSHAQYLSMSFFKILYLKVTYCASLLTCMSLSLSQPFTFFYISLHHSTITLSLLRPVMFSATPSFHTLFDSLVVSVSALLLGVNAWCAAVLSTIDLNHGFGISCMNRWIRKSTTAHV